jgi:hypothetical protein
MKYKFTAIATKKSQKNPGFCSRRKYGCHLLNVKAYHFHCIGTFLTFLRGERTHDIQGRRGMGRN